MENLTILLPHAFSSAISVRVQAGQNYVSMAANNVATGTLIQRLLPFDSMPNKANR